MNVERYLSFSETPVFMKQVDSSGSLDVLFAIQNELYENPERGDVIEGTSGARKARVSKAENKGQEWWLSLHLRIRCRNWEGLPPTPIRQG